MAEPTLPEKYSAARKALAAATRIDEVKDIRNKSLAMEVYALQAKDAELISMSVEIRKRAERRLGELIDEARKAGKLAKRPAGPGRGKRGVKVGSPKDPTLLDQGIDKHLADRARKAVAMTADKFEAAVTKAVKVAVAAVTSTKDVISAARAERHEKRVAERAQREQKVAKKISALPDRRYGVIYADPEWKFETYSPKGLDGSSADNHYQTSELNVIKARGVPSICANDAVLFLWATAPMMPHAIEVMTAWGFTYKSQCVWVKNKAGTGYWFRNQHELLLVGTRGKMPGPAEGSQWPSVIEAAVTRHSAKPVKFYELIESYFPNVPKIELNLRGKPRDGWDGWGNEALQEAAE